MLCKDLVVMCHALCVMCHVSYVMPCLMCYVNLCCRHVTCHVFCEQSLKGVPFVCCRLYHNKVRETSLMG